MAKIIILGCSLSAQQGYATYLQDQGHEITNLAQPASSNDLQQFLLGECFLQGRVNKELTIVWQITGLHRKSLVSEQFDPSFCHGIPGEGIYDWTPINVSMTGENRIWLLSNNDMTPKYHTDESVILQNLAIDIYRWSLLVGKIVVVMGWKNIAEKRSAELFLVWLKSKNITSVPLENSILDWCRETGQQFSDDKHPAKSGYINWCKHNLERLL